MTAKELLSELTREISPYRNVSTKDGLKVAIRDLILELENLKQRRR